MEIRRNTGCFWSVNLKTTIQKKQKQEKCDSERPMSAAVFFIKLGKFHSWWLQTAHPNSSHSLRLSPSPSSLLCLWGPVLSASLPASVPIFLVTFADSFINPINTDFSMSSTQRPFFPHIFYSPIYLNVFF